MWLQQEADLLRSPSFERLDITNLIEELEAIDLLVDVENDRKY